MKQTETEILLLKDEVKQMWNLVLSQLEKSKTALLTSDIELALEIVSREKRLDAFELKIESDCENYIALYSPVAVDLRFALSLMKVSSALERIGDFAEGIARHVIDDDCNRLDESLLEELQLENMFDTLMGMLLDGFVALETQNTKIAGKILRKDEIVDEIYRNSLDILTEYMKNNPEKIRCGLKMMVLLRKLERIGDHCSNLIEEIVFYVDAVVLKHNKKNWGTND